jgi:hypothetical protein
MSTIVLRSVKGTPLTNTEVDTNFTNLNTDKLEAATSATLTNKTINLTSNTLVATSAQLLAAITDETGTGSLVFATNPTLTGATLAGTVAGGGNQINNVIIGTSNPLAGAFTTLSASGATTLSAQLTASTGDGSYAIISKDTRAFSAGVTGSQLGFFGLDSTSTNNSLGAFRALAQTTQNGTLEARVLSSGSITTIGTFSTTGLAVTGALSATGNLTISGNGPNAIGGSTSVNRQFVIQGAFNASTNAYGLAISSSLTPSAGSEAALFTTEGTLNKAGSGTHADFASALLLPPTIGAGAATLTNASTLKITGAPSAGTNNYALWVAGGNVRLDSNVGIGTNNPSGFLANKLVVATGGTSNEGITIYSSSNNGSLWFADSTSGTGRYAGGVDYQHSTDALAFYSGAQGHLRLTSAGNLQFVTDSTGLLASDGYTMLYQTTAAITVGATNRYLLFATSASANAMTLTNTGNLVIGDTSAGARLHVVTTVPTITTMQTSSAVGGYLTFTTGSTIPLYIGFGQTLIGTLTTSDAAFRYSNNLVFGLGGSEVARFNSSGAFVVSGAATYIQKGGTVTSVTIGTGDNFGLSTSLGVIALDSGGTGLSLRMYSGGYYTPFTFGANGVMGVGGAFPTASGAGIQFPATQQASTDANVLDDYEEGSFTPAVSAASGSYTTVTATGKYVKVGRLVTIRMRVSITTNGTASGAMFLGNIPFPTTDNNDFGGGTREDVSTGLGYVCSGQGTTSIYINRYDGAYGLGDGQGLTFCISYVAAT